MLTSNIESKAKGSKGSKGFKGFKGFKGLNAFRVRANRLVSIE